MDWRLQRHPIARIIVVALLGFLALAAWALSSPAGSSPDDDFHLTSIWCAQGERTGLCENITAKSVDVPNDVVHAPCFAYHKEITGACQATLGTELFNMGRANELEHSYPNGFYLVMSTFAGPNVYLSVMLMRLFNALLFISMTVTTFLIVSQRWKKPLLIGLALTIVPLGMFIIPSTNPSSWTLYTPVFVFLLTRTLLDANSGKKPWLVGVSIVIFAAISSGARSDASIFNLFAIGLAAVASWRLWFKSILFYLVLLATSIITVLSVLSGRQTSAASGGLADSHLHNLSSNIGLFLRNIVDIPSLFAGIYNGDLGWLDTPMPGIVWVLPMLSLGGITISALAYRSGKELVIPLLALSFALLIPLAVSQASGSPIGALVQPRYVLPLFALTLVSLITTGSEMVLRAKNQWKFLLYPLAAANIIALFTNTLRYTSGMKTAAIFAANSWQTPVSPIVLGAIGVSATAALTIALHLYLLSQPSPTES